MPQSLNLKVKGLFTSQNEFSEVPEGALRVADNIDIIQDSVAQPRRGFDQATGAFSTDTDRISSVTEYQDHLIASHGTIGSPTKLSYYTGSAWTSLETKSPITDRRIKFSGANQNLYYTTSTGIRTIDSYSGTPRIAGGYKGIDITTMSSGSASIFSSVGDQVAYRHVWVYKDANNNLLFSAPSQREIFTASSTSAGVQITVTIPSGITTSWYLQIYRSDVLPVASVTAGGVPSDEMYLVYEAYPTAGEITAKSMAMVDVVPTSLVGAVLYTSPSQEGIGYANEPPPLAEDITQFANCMFYFNTVSKHRFFLTLISSTANTGASTITIGGVPYYAGTVEGVAPPTFKYNYSGTAAQIIDKIARSLVRVINQSTDSTVYAYYPSSGDDLPGKILLEERIPGGSAFSIVTNTPTAWSPTNIPSSGTAISSTNDDRDNGVAWSKPYQPEAVPLVNYVGVGSKNDAILRGIALRDAIYIFKKSGQVYKLTGDYPNFQVDKIEDSVKLIARETAVVLNNQIYCLTDQGVIALGDSTKVISRPIEQDLLSLVNTNASLVSSLAFGMPYEADRKYYLFLPSASTDTYPTQAYVFNLFTNTWVRHTLRATAGIVDHLNDVYLGHGSSAYMWKERKNYSFLDYVDYGFTTTITSISSTTVIIDSGTDNVAVGDLLWQSASLFAQVTAVDLALGTLTIESDPGLTVAAVTVLKGITTEVEWLPITMENPSILKHLHTSSLLFRADFVGTAYMTFKSDLSGAEETVTLTGRGLGLWGLFPWGSEPWGGVPHRRPVRQLIPRNKQRSSQLIVGFRHTWSLSNWVLEGLSVFGETGSEKTGRD